MNDTKDTIREGEQHRNQQDTNETTKVEVKVLSVSGLKQTTWVTSESNS